MVWVLTRQVKIWKTSASLLWHVPRVKSTKVNMKMKWVERESEALRCRVNDSKCWVPGEAKDTSHHILISRGLAQCANI